LTKRTLSSRLIAGIGVSVTLLALPPACGTPLPGPPTGPHRAGTGNEAIIVRDSPPPVQVECVPPQPREACVWVDGSWTWAGRRWEWLPGAWVVPPADCYHAHAYSQWLDAGVDEGTKGGRLFYFPAAWYPQRAGKNCGAPTVCLVAPPIEEC